MKTIHTSIKDRVATLSLDRGKANAINAEMVAELRDMLQHTALDEQIGGLILTGKPGFFSAGLDLIELYHYNEDQIRDFWHSFMDLTAALAAFKKPFITAISGHSPAGGCLLALCSDYRIMAEGKYVIGLNEVPVGIPVPAGIFQLYAFWIGQAAAARFLLEGRLLSPGEALEAGLVDEVVRGDAILTAAERQMKKYIQLSWPVWQQSKLNIRRELLASISADQTDAIEHVLKQWWSPQTRAILKTIIQNLGQQSAAGA